MSTYKLDMAPALEHLARNHGIPTTYVDLTHDARAKRIRIANAARSRKRAREESEHEKRRRQMAVQTSKDSKKGTHSLTVDNIW